MGELVERFKNLGVCATRAGVTSALAELALELELSGSRAVAPPSNEEPMDPGAQIELLALLSGVRRLPLKEAKTLSEEHKAVLLVVLGHRRKGSLQNKGGGDTRLEASSILDDLLSQGLIYCAVGLAGPTEASGADFISPAKSETFGELLSKNLSAFPSPIFEHRDFWSRYTPSYLAKSLLRNRRPSRPEMWSMKVARLRRASKEAIRASTLDVFWAKYIMRPI